MNMNRLFKIILSAAWMLLAVLPSHAQYSQRERGAGTMIVSAVGHYNNGEFDAAMNILKPLTESMPENDAAWYYLGLSYYAKRDLEMAEHCLRKASEIDRKNFWYRYRLAGLYAVTSRPGQTVEIYEGLLNDFPKKSDLYYDLVELYATQGQNEKALETLTEIEMVFGMTEAIAMFRFNLLMRMNRQKEAYKSLEDYNSRYSSPYVLVTLAEHELSTYNDSTALAYYNEALELAPDYSPALLGKAETYRMTRKYENYFSVLDKFVTNPADRPQAKTDYLMAVVQKSDPNFLRSFAPQMDSIVIRTLDTHPLDSGVLRVAGTYYLATGRRELAETHFRTNAVTHPSSLTASIELVEYLMYAEEWEDLSSEGRKAYMRFPKEPAFLEMAVVGDYNRKDYDSVLEACRTVLREAPADSARTLRAWSTIGDVHSSRNEMKKAYSAYDNALKINPGYVYVLNNYAYYLSMEGKKSKLKKAYKMSKMTIEAEPDNATYLDTFGWILFLQGKPEEAKPHIKRAMLYGGKDSVVIMDHYAEVLYALGEYDRAFVYWTNALQKNNGEVPDLEGKVKDRKKAIRK
jgi:tetratricopeptide (TPR) repeat protein